MGSHETEYLGERQWGHQVAAGETRSVAQRELGGVHPDRVDQKTALYRKPLRPRSCLAELAPELFHQHLRKPVLTGIQVRKDPVAERPGHYLGERSGGPDVRI